MFIRVRDVERTDKVRQRHVRDRKFVFQWLWKEREQKKINISNIYFLKLRVTYRPTSTVNIQFLTFLMLKFSS